MTVNDVLDVLSKNVDQIAIKKYRTRSFSNDWLQRGFISVYYGEEEVRGINIETETVKASSSDGIEYEGVITRLVLNIRNKEEYK